VIKCDKKKFVTITKGVKPRRAMIQCLIQRCYSRFSSAGLVTHRGCTWRVTCIVLSRDY